jgi:hypothetical protein
MRPTTRTTIDGHGWVWPPKPEDMRVKVSSPTARSRMAGMVYGRLVSMRGDQEEVASS